MDKNIIVHLPGTKVQLTISKYIGQIISIKINGNLDAVYQIAYYENGAYKELWFYSYQFVLFDDGNKVNIDFKI